MNFVSCFSIFYNFSNFVSCIFSQLNLNIAYIHVAFTDLAIYMFFRVTVSPPFTLNS